ncbi:Nucleoid occlusion factor SlmA [subsurface metagenome]|nr:TetR family transcriptional regulator [Clostridia bacterium]
MKEIKSKELSPKMVHLVETAKELFFRYGIKRVSIEEICQQSGVSKMTFYRYFPNKTAIAKHVLESIYGEGRERINSILAMEAPFEERLKKVLVTKMEYADKYSREFIKDLMMGTEPELKKYIEEENKKSLNEIRRIFLEAQKNGEIRSDIKVDFVIYMMNVMKEVFKDENLQKLYPDFASLMKDAFNFFYYGVLKK